MGGGGGGGGEKWQGAEGGSHVELLDIIGVTHSHSQVDEKNCQNFTWEIDIEALSERILKHNRK